MRESFLLVNLAKRKEKWYNTGREKRRGKKKMSVFENAKWIWQNSEAKKDEHAEFFTRFTYDGDDKALLRISVDSDYGVYINGKMVSHGQYGDFPHYKIYDEIDVTKYLRKGKTSLRCRLGISGQIRPRISWARRAFCSRLCRETKPSFQAIKTSFPV